MASKMPSMSSWNAVHHTGASKRHRATKDNTRKCSSKRTKPSPKPFPFFTLPRELRDHIYANTWESMTWLKVEYKDHTYQVCYTDPPEPLTPESSYFKTDIKPTQSPWLLTSVQILIEGTEQLQRHADWSVWLTCPTTSDTTAPVRTDRYDHSLARMKRLGPQDGRLLTVRKGVDLRANHDDAATSYNIPSANTLRLQNLFDNVTPFASLKHIRIQTSAAISGPLSDLRVMRPIDLSALEVLKGYKKVDIQVWFSVDGNEKKRALESLNAAFLEEMERVGRGIVGGKGKRKVWVERESRNAFVCNFEVRT